MRFFHGALLALLLSGPASAAPGDTLSLQGSWTMRADTGVARLAIVPGSVLLDLLRQGVVGDPRMEGGDRAYAVYEGTTWTYERQFNWTLGPVDEAVQLQCDAIDTYATVLLNGDTVGRAHNAFRQWTWPVGKLLREGTNTLRIVLHPIQEGIRRTGPLVPHDSDTSGVAPYVRKPGVQFGWDFMPRLVDRGIGGDLRLMRVREQLPVPEVRTVLRKQGVLIEVEFPDLTVAAKKLRFKIDGLVVKPLFGTGKGLWRFSAEGLARWWPHALGEQAMHVLTVEDGTGRLAARHVRFGVRTVDLMQERDSIGTAYYFRVNGKPLFMRGANVVPPTVTPTFHEAAPWVELVARAKAAHMDMLRVWAGGVYPPDAFFHACDTAGIMVWQDLMQGYLPPHDQRYWADLAVEVEQQTRRIARHPSIALFCGNNELDVAWRHWGWQERYGIHGSDSTRSVEAYNMVFKKMFPEAASAVDVPYVHTSPLSNWGNAEGLRHGSMHYWGVWHADSSLASYARNVGRFMVEYGFASWPDSALMAPFVPGGRPDLHDPTLRARQRSYRSDAPIFAAIEQELGMVPTDYAAFARASQQVQAIGMQRAIDGHRAAAPACMGSLVWQLNCPWPGPSWSLLEHDGTPKAAYQAVQAAFAR